MANKIEEVQKLERELWQKYLETRTEDDRQAWAQAHEALRKTIAEEWRKFIASGQGGANYAKYQWSINQ